ncbi:hypothetical protein MN116_008504, partial [Schistosoma mekongi]
MNCILSRLNIVDVVVVVVVVYEFDHFTRSDFNHIHWINEALKSSASDPSHLDQKASDLALQLQTQMNDVMQTLDHTCHEAIMAIPRVLREIDAVRIDALTLEADLKSLQQDNLQVDNKSQSIVNSLVELDRTRKNAQAAADALRETDRWINLTQCIDDLFETGDLDQLCSSIEGMDQCLISLIHLSDYDERIKQVDKYKNNLESLIAPKLIQSLDDLSLSMMMMMTANDDEKIVDHHRITSIHHENEKLIESTHHLINLLHRIGRKDAARKYYVNWLKEQVTGFWDRSTSKPLETATTSTLSDSLMTVLPSIIQKLSQYKSMVFTSNERSKLNCLPIFTDNEHIFDMNSSMINDVIYFYALLICFFKSQLNAKLFFQLQMEQSLHNHHEQQSYHIELLIDFTNSLESFKPFQTFTNSISNYQLIGCLFRITIGCLQCFEELLIPFYSNTTQEADCSIVKNNNIVDNNKVVHTSNNLKTGFIRLIQVFINPFINLPELFTNYIRKQFDYKLNELTITVNSNPSDVLEKLNEDIVNQSLALFYDTIHLCFEEIGAIAIPFVLDIIQ